MATRSDIQVFLLVLVIGCAGNPVPVDLPQDHPADPGAYESRFILPPDPFGTELTSARPRAHDQTESAAGRHKARGDLFESPAGHSANPEQEIEAGDRSPSETPHQNHMGQGQ
jgi:hypothetical protein